MSPARESLGDEPYQLTEEHVRRHATKEGLLVGSVLGIGVTGVVDALLNGDSEEAEHSVEFVGPVHPANAVNSNEPSFLEAYSPVYAGLLVGVVAYKSMKRMIIRRGGSPFIGYIEDKEK